MKAWLDFSLNLPLDKLEPELKELVKIRASQINGCAFCLEMHTREARAMGESDVRMHLLGGWRESPLYTPRERAALAWTEALTLIADTHAPDDVYNEVRRVFSEEESRFDVSARFFVVGIDMAGPTLMAHGTPEQQKQHIPPILDGTSAWSIGMSEPDAGSDVASIRPRAVRDGDRFVVNGQKIWNSGAASADWIYLICRTDPEAKKQPKKAKNRL